MIMKNIFTTKNEACKVSGLGILKLSGDQLAGAPSNWQDLSKVKYLQKLLAQIKQGMQEGLGFVDQALQALLYKVPTCFWERHTLANLAYGTQTNLY